MSRIVSKAFFVSACLGLLAGACFGLSEGWLIIQASLLALAFYLTEPGIGAAKAAQRVAAFTAAAFIGAHLDTALALPASVRVLALLPLAILVIANAMSAWLVGYASFALRVPLAVRLALVLPSLWTLQEWLFSLSDVAMPWFRLGYSQATGGPLAGAFPYGGVLLVTWLMLAMAGLIAVAFRSRHLKHKLLFAALAALTAASTWLAGRLDWTEPGASLDVELIQSGPTPATADPAAMAQIIDRYASAVQSSDASLIVTAQLAIPKTLASLPQDYVARLASALIDKQADALLGLHVEAPDSGALFNGVVGLGLSGPQLHLKHHLLPFGEFMPLPGALAAWVQARLPAPLRETAAGPLQSRALLAGKHRLAVTICFEAAFADAWRGQANTADMLVTVSSDSSIASPQFHRQSRQLAQARAREFQKPLLRTSDVQGTFIVDPFGRIAREATAAAATSLRAAVTGRVGLTPYARWGDSVALGIAILSLCFAASCMAPRSTPSTADCAITGPGAARQAGQVLPLAVVLLLVAGGMFHLMAHTGQAVTEKIRMTNAADAAAYSAAVAEARALNYDAYLNRAMVANEIAIAQTVSFASWMQYFATASDNFGANAADLNFFLLPDPQVARLDAVFGGSAYAAAYLGGRTVQDHADFVLRGSGLVVTALDAAVRALLASQEILHAGLSRAVQQQQIAQQVTEAMDPSFKAEVIAASHGFDNFTRRWARHGSSGDERGRLADVVDRSRDAFTRERNWTLSSFDIPLVRRDAALKKRAGTDLVGFDEWRAVDSLELHGRSWGCGKWGLSWCDDIRRPIGWGAVAVSADGNDAGRGHHGNAYAENPTTAGRAEQHLAMLPGASFSGLPDVREIADIDPAGRLTTGITLRVSKPAAPDRAKRIAPSGRLGLFGERPAGGEYAALSRAQVYFDRIAPRSDGQAELGSLYNPYWRVRLVAPTAVDRAEAARRQEGLALP
ncbi:MAG TPA: apolipoprotein N-acyltransferase [Albitalea sp.]|uniref:apolipoprotein N-acyltransferase n=1 Tax=Piscinibacter sp. TaxID=1903157 RepID=UPI002ED2139F